MCVCLFGLRIQIYVNCWWPTSGDLQHSVTLCFLNFLPCCTKYNCDIWLTFWFVSLFRVRQMFLLDQFGVSMFYTKTRHYNISLHVRGRKDVSPVSCVWQKSSKAQLFHGLVSIHVKKHNLLFMYRSFFLSCLSRSLLLQLVTKVVLASDYFCIMQVPIFLRGIEGPNCLLIKGGEDQPPLFFLFYFCYYRCKGLNRGLSMRLSL